MSTAAAFVATMHQPAHVAATAPAAAQPGPLALTIAILAIVLAVVAMGWAAIALMREQDRRLDEMFPLARTGADEPA